MEVNQQKLHELEQLCVQEQPPAAMAVCPLHVNCRDICGHISEGDFNQARAVYEKSVPFPEILSRVCEQPCRDACIRKNCGDALLMQRLERSAVEWGSVKQRRLFLSKKKERTAVIGGGITGLTAAVELGKKGYPVTIFEKEAWLWGSLRKDGRADEAILENEGKKLVQYGVSIELEHEIADPGPLLEQFDAVVIAWGLKKDPLAVKETIFQVEGSTMFAGGDAIRENFGTYASAMAQGKSLAISVDRFLKKVSMDAGREREGVFETTLHVRWDKEKRKESSAAKDGVLSQEEAVLEAQRCLDCKCTECTDACAFMRHYKSYPKKYLREIYNNLSIAMGTRHANKMINSCALCGQCAAVCPHGLNLGETIQEARRIMVEKKKMPQSAFEFAINDMNYSNSETAFLSRCQPGKGKSDFAFFPGCQLAASSPRTVRLAYLDLMKRMGKSVGLILGCCGVTADWAGEQELFEKTKKQLEESWKDQGCPVLIMACPTCYDVFCREMPDISCIGIWDVLLEKGLPQEYHKTMEQAVIHDSCGARSHPKVRKAVRTLAKNMGYQLEEEKYKQEQSLCCGFGGLAPVSNPQVADEMTDQWMREDEGLRLTYCVNCRDRLVKRKGTAVHILELLYDPQEALERKAPGYSLRRDNRFELKRQLLEELWNEKAPKEDKMKLVYSQETENELEERKILESDIRQVLEWSENGHRIRDGKSGCMIGHRQVGNVTFWVYYRVREDGVYEVERAYSHRMAISGEGDGKQDVGKIL